MSRWSRLIPVAVVSVLLAACGQGVTDTPFSPAAPLHDGGLLVGGNVTAPGDTTGSGSTGSTTSTTDTAPADTTSRGGGLLVGGN
jgi:hypothetical protein